MSRVYAVAYWTDSDGSTYEWPQGTVDNRRSRVLARIVSRRIPCDPATLVIHHVPTDTLVTATFDYGNGNTYITE